MRSTGIVLSCTLALALAAFAYWFLSPDRCSPLPRRERATDHDSHVAAAKGGSTGEVADGRDDRAAARHREEGEPTPSAATLRVRVRDDAGAPLAGVCVGVLKPAEPNRCGVVEAPLEFVDGTEASTSASGECDVALPDAGAIVDVAATIPGFAAGFWSRARAGDRIELELQHAIELTGFVRDRLGAPVAGARVSWSCLGPRRSFGETRSAADGSYRLVDVVEISKPSFFDEVVSPWIEVHADGFSELRFWSRYVVERSDERHWKLDLWPLHGGRLHGRVVDQVTKVPVAGAEVFLRAVPSSPPPPRMRTRSGADGRFVFDQLPAFGIQNAFPLYDDWNTGLLGDLCVVAPGHGSAWQRLQAPDDEEELERDFELPPVCDVRGRVVDEHGAPIAGARLEPLPPKGAHGPLRFDLDHRSELDDATSVILSDRDGSFVIRDLPVFSGAGAMAEIWTDGIDSTGAAFERRRIVVALVAGSVVTIPDVVMERVGGVGRRSIHFVDESGRDVPHAAYVSGTDDDDLMIQRIYGGDEDSRADSTGRASIPVDESGSGVGHAIRVVSRSEGFATAVIELPDGTAETTITLKPEHRLHGFVRDVDGRPGIAEVSAAPMDGNVSDAVGDRAVTLTSPTSGRFLLRKLGAGPWRVTATHREYDGRTETAVLERVADESKDLEIVLERSGTVTPKSWWEPGGPSDPEYGRVEVAVRFAASGRPVLHATINLVEAYSTSIDARPIAPGRYVLDHANPGRRMLRVVVPDAVTATRELTITAGATTEIAVEVESGAAIPGRLALDELPRWSWIALVAIDVGHGEEKQFHVGSDGSFELRGLAPECSYRLALDYVDERDCTKRWLCADPPRSATGSGAVWRPRFAATATIVAAPTRSRRFPDGATVRILDAEARAIETCTRIGGDECVCRQVLPGAYTVRLELADGTTQEQHVTVEKPDEPARVAFDLK